ncbi:MAG: hypothetical protein JSV52_02820 [Candidatus Zixiibacteriota bacterium]|nr:MAG: hypothetical protein JSV52_02820 [candidate division Zixibacteria bacterium]
MDYGRIISKSFEIAWRYKSLWIFGMFAGGGYSNFNINLPTEESSFFDPQQFGFPRFSEEFLGLFVLAAVAAGLVFAVASLISQAAIIDSVNRITRGGRYRFGDAFSAGLDCFWRFLGLTILFVISLMAAIFVLVIIGVIFFAVHTILGILSLLVLVPGGIFIFFYLISVMSLAERSIVVRNISIGDSLEEAFYLVRKHLGKVVVMFFIFLAFTIGFAIVSLIIWGIFAVPVAAVGLIGDMNPIQAILMGIVAGLPISLVIGGFLGVFFTNLYTLFYFELVEPSVVPVAQQPPPAPTMG